MHEEQSLPQIGFILHSSASTSRYSVGACAQDVEFEVWGGILGVNHTVLLLILSGTRLGRSTCKIQNTLASEDHDNSYSANGRTLNFLGFLLGSL